MTKAKLQEYAPKHCQYFYMVTVRPVPDMVDVWKMYKGEEVYVASYHPVSAEGLILLD